MTTDIEAAIRAAKAMESNALAQAKVAADMVAKLELMRPAPTDPPAGQPEDKSEPQQNEPVSEPDDPEPPEPLSPPDPSEPMHKSRRRPTLRRIVAEEFAKQTSHQPAADNIELWVTMALDELHGKSAPEDELRKALAKRISYDVDFYGFPRTGPRPDGAKVPETTNSGEPFIDASPSAAIPVISGSVDLPAEEK